MKKNDKATLMKLLDEASKISNAERCAICDKAKKGTRKVCGKCVRERTVEYLLSHGVTVTEVQK